MSRVHRHLNVAHADVGAAPVGVPWRHGDGTSVCLDDLGHEFIAKVGVEGIFTGRAPKIEHAPWVIENCNRDCK
jgi:hypothetical protein